MARSHDQNFKNLILDYPRDALAFFAAEEAPAPEERALLERLLQRRFGLLSPGVAERLRRASAGDLETWADQVLDANTLDDVFRVSRRKPAP